MSLLHAATPAPPAAHGEVAPAPRFGLWACLLALPLLAALLCLSEPAFRGRLWCLGDLLSFHIPLRYFYQECLQQGQNFLWCPWIGAGVDLHGEGQNGMLHPWHLALYGMLPFHWAFQLDLLSGILLAASGTVACLRQRGVPWAACLAGMTPVGLTGFGMIHLLHPNMVAVIGHLPWLIWAATGLFQQTGSRRHWLGLILATASQVYFGHPQMLIYSCLGEGLLYLVICPGPLPRLVRPWGWLLAGKLLGFGLGLPQLLPTVQAVMLSNRQVMLPGGELTRFALDGALLPANLWHMLNPWLAPLEHEYSPYAGVVTLLLAGLLPRFRHQLPARTLLALGLLGAMGLILALGELGLIYPWLARLPVFSAMRLPVRFVLFTHLALSLAAAWVLVRLWLTPPGPGHTLALGRWWGWPLAVAALACLPPCLVRGPAAVAFSGQATWLAYLPPALALLSVLALFLVTRHARLAVFGLVILVSVDMTSYGWLHLRQEGHETLANLQRASELPAGPMGTRVAPPFRPNLCTLTHQRGMSAYLAMFPRQQLDWLALETARLAGMAAWYTRSPNGAWQRHQAPNPLARARLLTRMQVSPDPGRGLPGIDPASVVLVAHALALPGLAPPGTVRIVRDDPGLISLHLEAVLESQALVLAESWHPGWRADLAGQPLAVQRAYGDFILVAIPGGADSRTLTVRFWPSALTVGLWGAAASLMLILAGCFLRRRRAVQLSP